MVRRLVLVVAFALGATTGLVGCIGQESTPNDLLSVDTVPPAAVANLEASVYAISSPSIELSWSPGFEADLAGYRVYRFEPARETGSTKRGQTRINDMELLHVVNEPVYVDADVTLGEGYSYAVSAFDVAGNEGPRVMTGKIIVAPHSRHPDQHLGSN